MDAACIKSDSKPQLCDKWSLICLVCATTIYCSNFPFSRKGQTSRKLRNRKLMGQTVAIFMFMGSCWYLVEPTTTSTNQSTRTHYTQRTPRAHHAKMTISVVFFSQLIKLQHLLLPIRLLFCSLLAKLSSTPIVRSNLIYRVIEYYRVNLFNTQ